MHVHTLKTFALPILEIHLVWFFFFLAGCLIRTGDSEDSGSFSLGDLVITSVTGMAVTGFVLLALGFSRLLNPWSIIAAVIVAAFLFWGIRKENIFSRKFWQRIALRLRQSMSIPTLIIWTLFLVLAIPAILPPRASDAVRYHLPYAVEWANAGRIYVDPFLRFPYYANNFILLYSGLFLFKFGACCQLLGWLAGLLSCLGIQAFISTPVTSPGSQPGKRSEWFVACLMPLLLALNPVFLRNLDNAYIDVPIGLFILAVLLCCHRSLQGTGKYWRELVIIAAFCAGMKMTLLACVPLFLILLVLAARKRLSARRIAFLCMAMLVLSLPWYLRNFLADGDPVPPFLNAWLKHPDLIFNHSDLTGMIADTSTDKSPEHLLLLPFRMFRDPESPDFREYGFNAAILLMGLTIPVLLAQLCFRNASLFSRRSAWFTASVLFLQLLWMFTSALGRYSLYWFPVYVAWLAVMFVQGRNSLAGLLKGRVMQPAATWVMNLACVALLWPSPGPHTMQFYCADFYQNTFPLLHRCSNYGPDPGEITGYTATEAVIRTLKANGSQDRQILNLMLDIQFYIASKKVVAVGDWFGPARYRDMWDAVQQRDVSEYLGKFDIAAVIVNPDFPNSEPWTVKTYPMLVSQLKRNGFIEYRCGSDRTPVFLLSALKPSPELQVVRE